MKKNLRIIDLFKIIILILISTIIVIINVAKKIEKTSEINQVVLEQKTLIEKYISETQNADNTKELLLELQNYIKEKSIYPNMIPTIAFFGKDNANKIIMYTKNDEKQKKYYIKEITNIKKSINSNDLFYITTEYNKQDGYITKVIIEYN